MKLLKIVLVALLLSILLPNLLSNHALVPKPCDNVTAYLISKGLVRGIYVGLDKGVFPFENRIFNYVSLIHEMNESRYLIGTENDFFVDCESGEVYDHRPTSYELLGPIVSKIDRGVRYWAGKVSVVPIYVGYFETTEERVDKLRIAGLEVGLIEKYIVHGNATNATIYRIAELDFATFIGDDKLYQNLTLTTELKTPKIVLLANSVDYSLSSGLLDFLRNNSIQILYTDSSNFESYKTEKFIVILGGPDAYEGVGAIARQVLPPSIQDYIRTKGNRRMFIASDVWSQGQVVYVVAGSDRMQTKLASEENSEIIAQEARIRG